MDDDECADPNVCPEKTDCVNLPGGYQCECKANETCQNVNECNLDTWNNCNLTVSYCVDLDVGYYCECNSGYYMVGGQCEDIDECLIYQGQLCDDFAECANTLGSFECKCGEGFFGDGFQCQDVDECSEGLDDCSEFADCLNIIGSYECVCPPGYIGNGTVCIGMYN